MNFGTATMSFAVPTAFGGWTLLLAEGGLSDSSTAAIVTAFVAISTAMATLVGWIVKRQFDERDKDRLQSESVRNFYATMAEADRTKSGETTEKLRVFFESQSEKQRTFFEGQSEKQRSLVEQLRDSYTAESDRNRDHTLKVIEEIRLTFTVRNERDREQAAELSDVRRAQDGRRLRGRDDDEESANR